MGVFAFREQTSIAPVQRFSRIVAAMLFDPPGIIIQWFEIKIANAITPPATTIAMLRHIPRICARNRPDASPCGCLLQKPTPVAP